MLEICPSPSSLPTIVLNSSTDSDFITVTRTKALVELKKRNILNKHFKLLIHNNVVQVPVLEKHMEAQGVFRSQLVTT